MKEAEYTTPEGAAKALGISLRTLAKRLAARQIGYERDGRKVLISLAEIERYRQSRKVPSRRVS